MGIIVKMMSRKTTLLCVTIFSLISPSLAIKCYVCDGNRNACMGSAEDLGTLTECPERDDICVTFYGWFTGNWKYNYYGTGPWDETTPLVARYCAAQEDLIMTTTTIMENIQMIVDQDVQ